MLNYQTSIITVMTSPTFVGGTLPMVNDFGANRPGDNSVFSPWRPGRTET